jgi:hypothetical protein
LLGLGILKQNISIFIMEELEHIVDELQLENDKASAADPDIHASLAIVEEFLKTHPVMCYGGTAINNLLPKKDQFYDPKVSIPDYDFFSKTPQEHAVIIANALEKKGIANIEVKPGIHLGTFKVFANYEGIADITELEPKLFDKLWKEDVVKNDIHYVPPNFLRMSMYLELSRPRGDVSRWSKVYSRLVLLNKHYPVACPTHNTGKHATITAKQKEMVINLLNNEPVVLLGVTAAEVHLRKPWTTPVALLANKETIEKLTRGKKVKIDEATEILPPRISVIDEDGSAVLRFYETTACHSFHTVRGGTRVASIPTILQFFFAYIYSDVNEDNIGSILCIAQRLVDMAAHKPERRFALLTPKECLGEQETLIDMKRNKAELHAKLGTNKSSPEFLKYFFTYNPRDTKTQRNKAKQDLRKTRRSRQSS